MRCLGLLAGVGSLLWEAKEAGCEIIGNIETRTPYRTGRHLSWDLNFPGTPLFTSNTGAPILSRPDIIIGHPPCGSHSQLGNSGQPAHKTTEERRAMQAVRHQRVGLLPYFVEQVNALKPRCFALDNLPKILQTVTPVEWWRAVLPKYSLTFVTMLNWDYGTPQLRKRLWVIGMRRPMPSFDFKPIRRRPKDSPSTALEAFSGLSWRPWKDDPSIGHVHISPELMLTGDYRTTDPSLHVEHATQLALGFLSIPPNKAWPYLTRFGRLAVKIGRSRLPFNEKSRTITGLPSVHHPYTGWPLTGRERARLMDWPDTFALGHADTTYDRTALMRLTLLTGKAVPSAFPRYLIPQLMAHLEKHS